MDIDSSSADDDFTVVSASVTESTVVHPEEERLSNNNTEPTSGNKFMDALLNESETPFLTAAAADLLLRIRCSPKMLVSRIALPTRHCWTSSASSRRQSLGLVYESCFRRRGRKTPLQP
jgi:hypothetical protein